MSRQQLPKQFLKLKDEQTLLEATIARLSPIVEREDVCVVTNEAHALSGAFEMLDGLTAILEPVGRNTAPAIALAAAWLLDFGGGDDLMLVLPADHLIRNEKAFQQCLLQAVEAAKDDVLVAFGIVPERADTGFGYIQADRAGEVPWPVIRFTEKPDIETARAFVTSGDYFWNSGMFVWKASVILSEIEHYLPELFSVLQSIRTQWQDEPWEEVVRHRFREMPAISIDYGVMEKSDRVRLIPADIGWSDVGSWDAVHAISKKDESGNALSGNVLALDCQNTLLRSNGRLLAAVGLEDVIAVETPDAILLVRRGESQRVREVVDILKERGGSEHLEHVTVRRPWGSYTVLDDPGSGYKLKRIEVNPGGALSLQRHRHRSEHWVVVSGMATVTRGKERFKVGKNESTYIPIGEVHRLENLEREPLVIIEVQVGDYLGEDDIERLEDSYGRIE